MAAHLMELTSVLDQLMERMRERGSEANTATMTLVVFFEDATTGALARDRIRALAGKHPSRVVILDGTQDETLARVERSDWIELGVKNGGAGLLYSAANTLRLPEAPVVLLWIAPGIGDDERFVALSHGARTIVYNSSLVDIGDGALRELIAYVGRHPELPIADIAYLRLGPWQESVAILFDGEEAAELLDLARVEISCGSEPESLYLLGWLASRLGWKPRDGETLSAPSGKTVRFALRCEGEPRRIRRVALSSSRSTFLAEVNESGETIVLSVEGGRAKAPRLRAINNPGVAALLERAILTGHHDRIFEASLAVAGEVLGCGARAS
jgi:glucose-6-phosphate dehydrogenase assembly protein OpcA